MGLIFVKYLHCIYNSRCNCIRPDEHQGFKVEKLVNMLLSFIGYVAIF